MVQYIGYNVSSAEGGNRNNNRLAGYPEASTGSDYVYPWRAVIGDYPQLRGLNCVRVPLSLERFLPAASIGTNPATNDPSNDIAILRDRITYAESKGVKVVIDAHGAGLEIARTGSGLIIGESQESIDEHINEYVNFYNVVAQYHPNIVLGWNEPHLVSAEQWLNAANQVIAALRAAGSTHLISVPGSYWDGAWSWFRATGNINNGGANSVVMLGVVDPLNNYMYEVHQYMDEWGSGVLPTLPDFVTRVFVPITEWARTNNKKLFLGEFGIFAKSAYSENESKLVMDYIRANDDVWWGATAWAITPWDPNSIYALNPVSGLPAYWDGNGTAPITQTVVDRAGFRVLTDTVPGPYLIKKEDHEAAVATAVEDAEAPLEAEIATLETELDEKDQIISDLKVSVEDLVKDFASPPLKAWHNSLQE